MSNEFDAAVAATMQPDQGQAARVGFSVAADTNPDAYAEAQRMAAVLKASLGTDTLVPADEAAASGLVPTPAAAAPEPKRKSATRTAAKPLRKPAAAPAAEPAAGEASNPFKDLN